MKKITMIGGGTGSFTMLSGLKKFKNLKLAAIVPSTDSGGSAGRLRDEFGYLPIGDVRQCLVALAENEEEEQLLRNLFMYRFDKGEHGLRGHNFGNIFLTALTEVLEGNQINAIKTAQRLLNIKGDVYPITMQNCELVAEYENGKIITGEHSIEEPSYPHDGRLHIVKLYTKPHVETYKNVIETIKNSDFIIMGPGDLYTSIIANLVIDEVAEHIRNSNAKVIYNLNLVSKFGQTFGFEASDFVNEIIKYLGKPPDYIFVNNTKLPKNILKRYALENACPVEDNLNSKKIKSKIIRGDFLAQEVIKSAKGDILKRSLIRHDGYKVALELQKLI